MAFRRPRIRLILNLFPVLKVPIFWDLKSPNIEKYRRNDNPLFLHDYYFLTLFNLAIHSYRHEHSDNHSYEYTYNQSYEP